VFKFKEVNHYGLRSISSLILFGISKNYLNSGRSLLFYQSTRMAVILTVVNYHGIALLSTSYKILPKYHSPKVKSIYRINYWEALWVSA
jgi:hypothetical protein